MDLGGVDWRYPYLALLGAVGAARLGEMRLSRRHQRDLAARGLPREREPGFPVMVALHVGILAAAAVEVLVARRPLNAAVAIPALGLFAAANVVRVWVIRTMAGHWNVQVVNSLSVGVVASGPFRWVRHPNYAAVFVELVALPLVGGAYVTAIVGAIAHVAVLARRIAFEEKILLADPAYRAAMGKKPRFLPIRLAPTGRRRRAPAE
jgi:methyltransferase